MKKKVTKVFSIKPKAVFQKIEDFFGLLSNEELLVLGMLLYAAAFTFMYA